MSRQHEDEQLARPTHGDEWTEHLLTLAMNGDPEEQREARKTLERMQRKASMTPDAMSASVLTSLRRAGLIDSKNRIDLSAPEGHLTPRKPTTTDEGGTE